MQHPRRTSEFHDEIGTGTVTKRNSRSTQSRSSRNAPPSSMDRQTLGLTSSVPRGNRTTPQKAIQGNCATDAPGTANKYTNRPNRIARPTSMERQTLGQQGSALRGARTTPQQTPTSNSKITRVLFTAEKQRNAHNDKMWIQERAQQIAEYLRSTANPGAVHGLSWEFFARSGCLRQLSTKQFVAIVNYFLHHIWGTRFKVGSNYVDDIINIMQKLQYPHQVNKSWLKTPNTPHSFGFVIQLFDFFMDFVPPQNEGETNEMRFEFEDPENLNQSSLMQESPDAEFTALVLQNSEEGFKLWDKQLEDELLNLQQQTSDVLIYKRSGIQDMASLDVQLDELKKELSEVRKKRPNINEEEEDRYILFENELKETKQQLHITQESLEVAIKKLSELQAERHECKNEFMQMLEKVEQIKNTIAKQTLSSEQRDIYVQELEQRKYTLQCMERTLGDVESRQHHQQVLLSRHKKHLTDQISKYNDHIHAISCTKLPCDASALQLPLHPQLENVKECLKLLEETRAAAYHKQQQTKQEEQELDKQAQELTHIIISNLRPRCAELETAIKLAEHNSKDFAKEMQKQCSIMNAQLQELEVRLQQLEVDSKSLQNTKHEKQMLLEKLEMKNEELMNRAEAEYKAAADEREAGLDEYEKKLEQANAILLEFADEIDKRELLLKRIEEEQLK